MRTTATIIVLTLLTLIGANEIFAQQIISKKYMMQDGLSSNRIYDIVQDSFGFIWVGTDEGLNRFDGTKFQSYYYSETPGAISSNSIRRLLIDRNNKLWVSLDNGIDIYDPSKDTFSHFEVKTKLGETIDTRVLDIIEDGDGEIWIATYGKGLFRYNPKTNTLLVYKNTGKEDDALVFIVDIENDSRGNIWIATYSDGIRCLNKKTGEFRTYKKEYGQNSISDNSIQKIYEDSYGNIWIGTFQNGLDCFDFKTNMFRNYKDNQPKNLLYHIQDIKEYKPGELIIASDNGVGLFRVSDGRFISNNQSYFKIANISNKFVYNIFIDKEESVWLGSYFDGLYFYSDFQNNFEYYTCSIDKNSKDGSVINVIREDDVSKKFWIGTDNNGLFLFDPETKTTTPYRTAADINSTYYCIHDLLIDNGKLYLATFERGLEVLDIKTKQVVSYLHNPADPTSLPSSRLFAIYKASNGRLYIGTSQGLCYYNPESSSFVKITTEDRVSAIAEDSSGKIWFTTFYNGLYVYDQKTEKMKQYKFEKDNKSSLIRNTLNSLAIDRKKRLWIGSYGYGFCRYDEVTNSFVRYDNIELPNNVISAIIPDGDFLWITTNKGLVLYNPDTGYVKTYSASNGLYNEQFTPGAGIKASNGKIVLGSTDGFCFFSRQNLAENTYNPNILITNMTIFGKNVSPNDEGSPLKSSIEYTKQITLNHKQSVIGFEFASLSYIAPERIEYRYMLEGFDYEWRTTKGDYPFVSYTNLAPGEYTLIVEATNSDRVWSTNKATLKIKIRPPFFKTTVAYILYAILLLVMVTLFIKYYYKRSEKKQREKIEKINIENERNLNNSKIDFFTNIAHEIRTPLSLILGPLELLMKSKKINDSYGDYLQIIEQNYKRLYSLVSELLDFRKVDAGIYKFNYTICCIKDVIEKVTTRFEWNAKQKNILIDTSNISSNISLLADEEALTKITSNLLTNAMKYAKSKVVISVQEENEWVHIYVIDDGVGIPNEEKDKIFDAFYQVKNNSKTTRLGIGIGLHLTHSLVTLMEGEISISDRSDGNDGACFLISFPKRQETPNTENATKKVEEFFILGKKEEEFEEISDDLFEQNQAKRYSILAIDDNSEILDFVSKILSQEYFVISALSGEEALKILENNQVDLVVSDIMMDGMDGLELCRYIKSNLNTSHIPVVLLTAKTDTQSKIEGLESGADAYIEKPFSPSYFKTQLKILLKKRHELKEDFASTPLSEIYTTVHNKIDEEFVTKCTEIIDDNISEPDFSVSTLANELGMSRTAVFVKIKGITGMTPNDFIKVIRLKTACKMMVESDYRITEIGFLVGFSSSSYFAKCFQKQFGVLPTEYLKKIRKQ